MKMRFLKMYAAVCMLLLVFGCGADGGGGSDTPSAPTAASLDITSDNYQLTTNGLDKATLTIVARDNSNAAISGVVVTLSATAGILSASSVTTDATGTATVTFSPGPDKSNQVVSITATSGSQVKTLPITLVGTTVSVIPSKSSLLAGVGDNTTLTVTVRDGGNSPVPGAPVALSSSMGNSITAGTTTASLVTLTTGINGTATATLTATTVPGTDIITASSLGAQGSNSVNVTNAKFGFTSPANGSTIATGKSTTLTVTWTDAAGKPVNGGALTFTTTGGYFDNIIGKTTTFKSTNASGQATVTFTASATATPADITVTSATESDTLHLLVASINPSRLTLQATPSVLSPSVGGVSSSSTITATVRDASNQLVSGETVVFSIVSGPGGGESLSPGTAVTGAGGTASVTFTSGSATSAQNGVRIRATINADTAIPISAETTLTIGQQATSVVLGTTNKISKVIVNGLEIGYALPFSVLVVDNNGNPIPNATVNLGIYPLFFYTGTDAGGRTGKFKNEDLNRNGILDPGEDGALGEYFDALFGDPPDPITMQAVWNSGSEGLMANIIPKYLEEDQTPSGPLVINKKYPGTPNGRLDPGGVATIPASVITDEAGLAAFEIKYAKAYGNWVQVEITATTQVAGDLSTSKIEPTLSVMEGDTPFPDSPFGW